MENTNKKGLTIKEHFKSMIKMDKNPQEGLREYYEVYGLTVYTIAKVCCRDTIVAQEVTNQTFAHILQSSRLPKLIFNPNRYVYKLTCKYAKKVIKKLNKMPIRSSDYHLLENLKVRLFYDNEEFFLKIAPYYDKAQIVVALYFVVGYEMQEIAKMMGLSLKQTEDLYEEIITVLELQGKTR